MSRPHFWQKINIKNFCCHQVWENHSRLIFRCNSISKCYFVHPSCHPSLFVSDLCQSHHTVLADESHSNIIKDVLWTGFLYLVSFSLCSCQPTPTEYFMILLFCHSTTHPHQCHIISRCLSHRIFWNALEYLRMYLCFHMSKIQLHLKASWACSVKGKCM